MGGRLLGWQGEAGVKSCVYGEGGKKEGETKCTGDEMRGYGREEYWDDIEEQVLKDVSMHEKEEQGEGEA